MAGFRHFILCVVIACVALHAQRVNAGGVTGASEPSYQGKKLGDWLLDLDPYAPPEVSFEPFRHFDSNAVPFLVHIVQQTDITMGNFPMAVRAMGKHKGEQPSAEIFGTIRANAAYALGELGTNALSAVPDLIKALDDDSLNVITSSMIALSRIVPPDTNAFAAMSARLKGEKFYPAAAWGTAYSNAPSLRAAAALARDGTNRHIMLFRPDSIVALARIGIQSPETVPVLARELPRQPAAIKRGIASAAGGFGERAIPLITAAASDSDLHVRWSAASTVWKWGVFEKRTTTNDHLKTALLVLSTDPEPRVRENAMLALVWMRPVTSDTIAALVKALDDPSQDVRVRAAEALGRLGKEANEALPALQKAAESGDRFVSPAAAWAIKAVLGEISNVPGQKSK